VVLGNCCIKRFIPKDLASKTCSVCKKPHRNRRVDKCNGCRDDLCITCNRPYSGRGLYCWNCM
jgi:hypothetical protein